MRLTGYRLGVGRCEEVCWRPERRWRRCSDPSCAGDGEFGRAVEYSRSAVVTAVSCSDGGTCAAGGQAFATAGQGIPFVLTGKNGQWGRGVAVPGLATLKPADAGIDSVSCAPAGGCVAGGTWVNTATRNHVFHVFVTSERNGRWSHLTELFKGKLAAAGVDLSCPANGKLRGRGWLASVRGERGEGPVGPGHPVPDQGQVRRRRGDVHLGRELPGLV